MYLASIDYLWFFKTQSLYKMKLYLIQWYMLDLLWLYRLWQGDVLHPYIWPNLHYGPNEQIHHKCFRVEQRYVVTCSWLEAYMARLYLGMDTDKTHVTMTLDYVLKTMFNSIQFWEGLCGHLKRSKIFTRTMYNFCTSFSTCKLILQSVICNC